MENKNISIIGIIIAVLILLAASPWITKDYAEKRVVSAFEEGQKGIIDGCGFNCAGCGIVSSEKVIFGYLVNISYGCGLRPTESNAINERATKFVSFLGTVH